MKYNPSIEDVAKNNSTGRCELCNTTALSEVSYQFFVGLGSKELDWDT